jgi:hypothetical protein
LSCFHPVLFAILLALASLFTFLPAVPQ